MGPAPPSFPYAIQCQVSLAFVLTNGGKKGTLGVQTLHPPATEPDGPSSLLTRKEETARNLVNDKREILAQRQRYEHYSVVVEEVGSPAPNRALGDCLCPAPFNLCFCCSQVPIQPGEALPYRGDDYEDEYDDTYDGNQVGANDADSDDELISRR